MADGESSEATRRSDCGPAADVLDVRSADLPVGAFVSGLPAAFEADRGEGDGLAAAGFAADDLAAAGFGADGLAAADFAADGLAAAGFAPDDLAVLGFAEGFPPVDFVAPGAEAAARAPVFPALDFAPAGFSAAGLDGRDGDPSAFGEVRFGAAVRFIGASAGPAITAVAADSFAATSVTSVAAVAEAGALSGAAA